MQFGTMIGPGMWPPSNFLRETGIVIATQCYVNVCHYEKPEKGKTLLGSAEAGVTPFKPREAPAGA